MSLRLLCIGFVVCTLAACAHTGSYQHKKELDQMASPLLVDLDREPDAEIPLWPAGVPGAENVSVREHYVHRENRFGLKDRAANDVTNPTLTLFKSANPDGSALLIIPGGGYKHVVVEKEGFEGARYFNTLGATVYVLKYRLPHQGWSAGPDTPLQDTQRAMRVIRARATQDGIDPNRVMSMGFSAGGHMAGSLAARFAEHVYAPVDDTDTLSARPDASVLVYPVATMDAAHAHMGSREHLLGANPSPASVLKYSLEINPPANTPPTFILHAADDGAVPVENAVLVFNALKAVDVPVTLHIFETGGHGFGLRGIDDTPLSLWPELVYKWGQTHNIFKEDP
ncbi:MAG: alpha/beta hydrolase [Robiginitomaculum sp.]|nr:MAG: alpha/beta hydrolase [Robiginitomaculum sp.]